MKLRDKLSEIIEESIRNEDYIEDIYSKLEGFIQRKKANL